MNAAVVKFNTLADTVWAAAENHHFFTVGRTGFAFFFVSGVEIGGFSGKLGGAGVDAFVNRMQVQRIAVFADFFFAYV